MNNQNRDREISGLLQAMDKFNLNKGYILTNDQEEIIKVNEHGIIILPVWKWLLTTNTKSGND